MDNARLCRTQRYSLHNIHHLGDTSMPPLPALELILLGFNGRVVSQR